MDIYIWLYWVQNPCNVSWMYVMFFQLCIYITGNSWVLTDIFVWVLKFLIISLPKKKNSYYNIWLNCYYHLELRGFHRLRSVGCKRNFEQLFITYLMLSLWLLANIRDCWGQMTIGLGKFSPIVALIKTLFDLVKWCTLLHIYCFNYPNEFAYN